MLGLFEIVVVNWVDMDIGGMGIIEFFNFQFDCMVIWEYVCWMKEVWGGLFVIKGICCVDDVCCCFDVGVDVVWIFNYGGCQLDIFFVMIDILLDIVVVVCGQVDIIFDGGVCCGIDIIKVIVLGVIVVVVGCFYFYGLGVVGEVGVSWVLELLMISLECDMVLIGVVKFLDFILDFVCCF